MTCLAVECTPGELAKCRGDLAITCNSEGSDFDLIQCPFGCGSTSGCKECATNDQCANPTPVCDSATGSCRGCSRDDECASSVCEEGNCVAEATIVYAAPGGSETGTCVKSEPCSISRASGVVFSAAVPPILRLLPGSYAVGLAIGGPTNGPLRVVGTGAHLLYTTGIRIDRGANVFIRGVAVTAASTGVVCEGNGGTGEPRTTLTIRDAVITAGDRFTSLVQVAPNCSLEMSATELNLNSADTSAIFLGSDAFFSGDRLHIHGEVMAGIGAFGSRMGFRLTNSLIERAFFGFGTTDMSAFYLGFNTFDLEPRSTLDCRPDSQSPTRTILFDNNIVSGRSVPDIVSGTACVLRHNVLFPQATPITMNTTTDPQFVDPAAKNFRLKSTSPAIDSGVATDAFPGIDHDFDGLPRPQGARLDIGAFERNPDG